MQSFLFQISQTPKGNNAKNQATLNKIKKKKSNARKPKKGNNILTEKSSEMLENSSLAFLEIHELPNPTFKLLTLVRALSIFWGVYASLPFTFWGAKCNVAQTRISD